jgi:Tfp pilus assembly pilus retraction ATPase PilT
MIDLDQALMRVIETEASDLHLKIPSQPLIRLHGRLEPLVGEDPLTPDQLGLGREDVRVIWARLEKCSERPRRHRRRAARQRLTTAERAPGARQ